MITDGLQIIVMGTAAVFLLLTLLALASWLMAFAVRKMRTKKFLAPSGGEDRCVITAAVLAAIARLRTERKGS